MRAVATSAVGSSGESFVQAWFEQAGWAVAPNPREHDLGTDLWVSPRDERRFDLGLMVGVQVKNGESMFAEPGEVEGVSGWWFRDSLAHFDYWAGHASPHIIIIRSPSSGDAFWVHVDRQSIHRLKVNGKLFVRSDHPLDSSALPLLIEVAAAARPRPRWAGSAWTGDRSMPVDGLLRHALLAPRLIAPHPNRGVDIVEAEQAVALLTAGRLGELQRYRMPESGAVDADWTWQYFYAILSVLETGSIDALQATLDAAEEPHQRAAVAVSMAAFLVEQAQHEDALEVLERVQDRDDVSPIDHAWLQLHRARSLSEIGAVGEATELAVATQALPALWPEDVTATALAGSGAALVFSASDNWPTDVGPTITAGDSETQWWQAQITSWGMEAIFDESFRRWTRNSTEVRFAEDAGWNRMRGVSLMAGFSAAHGRWRNAISILARMELIRGSSDAARMADVLSDLRLVGDAKSIKAAVGNLLETGPVQAIIDALQEVDLDRVGKTDARASMELIIGAADVIPERTADAIVEWVIALSSDLTAWVQRVRPSFVVWDQFARMLQQLYPVLSPAVSANVRRFVLCLPSIPDAGGAHRWVAVVRSIPHLDWTEEEGALASVRSGDHAELTSAFESILLARGIKSFDSVVDSVRAGELDALAVLRDPSRIPTDAVPNLVSRAAQMLRDRLAEGRSGVFSTYGGVDPGRALIVLNTDFPEFADWQPILEVLREPLAHPDLLEGVLNLVASRARRVPDDVSADLLAELQTVADRAPISLSLPLLREDLRPLATAAMDALAPAAVDPTRWLNSSDLQGRLEMIRAIARRLNVDDLPVLLALGVDAEPQVRASVAQALSFWAVNGLNEQAVIHPLNALLDDSGTLVARRVVGEWHDGARSHLRETAGLLISHPSARVRKAAEAELRLSAP